MVRDRLTDAEWAIFAPFLTEQSARGGRPPKDHRRTLDGIFWITRTGAPWRDLPEELGKWNSVHRQFRRVTNRRLYALRSRIECFINRLKNCRRVATRYDHTASSFLGFALLGCIRLWIRFVHAA